MKKNLIFKRNILAVVLFCIFLPVFADSSLVITALQAGNAQSKNKNAKRGFMPCKGISSLHGTTRKVVALTFDDGPSKGYTEQILKILKSNKIRGTFFFVGKNVRAYPDIARAVYREGNVIANHSYSHQYLSPLDDEEIEWELIRTSKIVKQTIGVYPLLFRPPYGACSQGSVRVAKNLNFKTIMWSAVAEDYLSDRTTVEKITSLILGSVHPGAIILLHDGGGNREKTVEALKIIINALLSEGYEFVTIPELLDLQPYYIPKDAYQKGLT